MMRFTTLSTSYRAARSQRRRATDLPGQLGQSIAYIFNMLISIQILPVLFEKTASGFSSINLYLIVSKKPNRLRLAIPMLILEKLER
jgi:hypothetical protein